MWKAGQINPVQRSPEHEKSETSIEQLALNEEYRILMRLGFAEKLITTARQGAALNGTTIECEILASNQISPHAYYRRLAAYLGLPFSPNIDVNCLSDRPKIDNQLLDPRGLRLEDPNGESKFAVVPVARSLTELHRRLSTRPELRRSVIITTPEAVREAVWQVGAKRRLHNTIHRLFSWKPHFSARIVFWGKQGFIIGGALGAAVSGLLFFPLETLLTVHILLTFFYLLAVLLRLASVRSVPQAASETIDAPSKDMPVYTIMVALYREANMVRQLSTNLQQLNWPRSKLDIKLICEADDHETINAIKALNLPSFFELVAVPPAKPRTKPKALTYALSGARGSLLTIYDAEDRPHQDQLMEAWTRFRNAPPELACLQAPLNITNISHNWITSLFACEYSGLFRGVLPFLAKHHFPMPLGGTSNHFRTAVLKRSRAWDPFNVAEDADLGLRLHRMGYYCGVLTRGTEEEAPVAIGSWVAQRSRWIKGWLQTLLVAFRDPAKLNTELGSLNLTVFVVNSVGMIISALLHPLLYVALAMTIVTVMLPNYHPGSLHQLLSGIDIANILLSYWAFLRLGMIKMTPPETRKLRADALHIPFYWLMLSFSAWKAFFELYRTPFLWRKTSHKASPDGAPAWASDEQIIASMAK